MERPELYLLVTEDNPHNHEISISAFPHADAAYELNHIDVRVTIAHSKEVALNCLSNVLEKAGIYIHRE